MNYAIVKFIIGKVLYFEAAFMMLPCVTAIIYQEESGWAFFLQPSCACSLALCLPEKVQKTLFFM